MGSSGSSSFSDYSEKKPSPADANNGGTSKIDKCNIAFASSLEEVSRCQFYKSRGILPPLGTEIIVTFNGVRVAVVEATSSVEIGYLPTKFNYIKTCLDNGFAYSGTVRSNVLKPSPTVLVDVVPT